jgi:hypothetical protein
MALNFCKALSELGVEVWVKLWPSLAIVCSSADFQTPPLATKNRFVSLIFLCFDNKEKVSKTFYFSQ